MAEMCLELREEIVGAHGAYVRCATRNGANFILPGLYDRLARLLGHNMANGIVRDHPPPEIATAKVISVQDFGVASSFPSNVLHAAIEHGGLGVPKLLDETTKTRLQPVPETVCDFYPNNPNIPSRTRAKRQ